MQDPTIKAINGEGIPTKYLFLFCKVFHDNNIAKEGIDIYKVSIL